MYCEKECVRYGKKMNFMMVEKGNLRKMLFFKARTTGILIEFVLRLFTEHVPTTRRKILKACLTLFIAAYGAGLTYR